MTIGARIKQRRLELHKTLDDLAAAIGTNRSTIHKYESGLISNVPSDKIEAIANVLRTTPAYLMGWEPEEVYPIGETYRVPVIGFVKAGFNGVAYEDYLGYELATDISNVEDCRYLRVKGNSMLPEIKPGDYALVQLQEDVESGDLAVVIVNGEEGMIKKVLKQDNAITLVSFNQEYPPRIFVNDDMDQVHIYGKVKEIKRKF